MRHYRRVRQNDGSPDDTCSSHRLSVISIDISHLSSISFIDQKSSKVFGDSPAFSYTSALLDGPSISVPRRRHSVFPPTVDLSDKASHPRRFSRAKNRSVPSSLAHPLLTGCSASLAAVSTWNGILRRATVTVAPHEVGGLSLLLNIAFRDEEEANDAIAADAVGTLDNMRGAGPFMLCGACGSAGRGKRRKYSSRRMGEYQK